MQTWFPYYLKKIQNFEVACDIKVVVNETLIYASILTIVAFTIERCETPDIW